MMADTRVLNHQAENEKNPSPTPTFLDAVRSPGTMGLAITGGRRNVAMTSNGVRMARRPHCLPHGLSVRLKSDAIDQAVAPRRM